MLLERVSAHRARHLAPSRVRLAEEIACQTSRATQDAVQALVQYLRTETEPVKMLRGCTAPAMWGMASRMLRLRAGRITGCPESSAAPGHRGPAVEPMTMCREVHISFSESHWACMNHWPHFLATDGSLYALWPQAMHCHT